MEITDKILCKDCRWEGRGFECKPESNEFVKGLIIFLCPKCDTPLIEKREEDLQLELIDQNAVIMGIY